MKPVTLTTARLTLDQPAAGDRVRVIEYCRDPRFETFMTLPWPYEEQHADYFIERVVPEGWASGTEFTWALRRDGEFLGVVGYRAGTRDLGYWLGAPHRGNGYMTEAVEGVIDWLFSRGHEPILWECVVGNHDSAAVARRLGFRYSGEWASELAHRDGSHPAAWHAELLRDDRAPKDGWPR